VKKRVQISLTFSAEMDPGHDNLDYWIKHVRSALILATPNHAPRVAFGTVRVVAPTWKDYEARFGREDT
jgi:hypothetical protein